MTYDPNACDQCGSSEGNVRLVGGGIRLHEGPCPVDKSAAVPEKPLPTAQGRYSTLMKKVRANALGPADESAWREIRSEAEDIRGDQDMHSFASRMAYQIDDGIDLAGTHEATRRQIIGRMTGVQQPPWDFYKVLNQRWYKPWTW